jgi:hypothetical protein
MPELGIECEKCAAHQVSLIAGSAFDLLKRRPAVEARAGLRE